MPLLQTLLRITNFQSPLLRTLIPSIGAAFALQTAVALPSIYFQSERFYDLSGSLTYLSVTALSLYLPALRARAAVRLAGKGIPEWPRFMDALMGIGKGGISGNAVGWNWRQVVVSTAVAVWAARLGSYLFQRVLSDGKDSRFDEIKKSPPKFFIAFMVQATWITLCLLPILALNSLPSTLLSRTPLKLTDILGLSLYIGGLGFEVVADRQRQAWSEARKRKEHEEEFLTSGLWGRSRHPNYFGESTLWTGLAITSAGILTSSVGQVGLGLSSPPTLAGRMLGFGMCAISPAFVTFLLFKISGIPLSEKKYDERYGGRKEYREWKERTPVFFPRIW